MSAFQYFRFSPLIFLPLAWLWFQLINHLRVEWSVNPQYAYGWAVPFLCLHLFWAKAENRKQKAEIGGRQSEILKPELLKDSSAESPAPFSISAFQRFSFFLLAFLYLPTRLIQEANPEWRMVSWALAFEVIGLTLLLLKIAERGGRGTEDRGQKTEDRPRTTDHGPQTTEDGGRKTDHVSRFAHHASRITHHVSAFRLSGFVFPICFFLVAVPWPTFIEGPLVQGLMRANVGVTIALLGLTGVPAIQHGNVIEVASGMVGVDDACSGIRSFQAALMISLFLGELYALSARRRVQCVVAGFALAFLFNVGRTLLLTWVASAKGVGAVASWHDPAGVTILVGCFLSLWLIARRLRRKTDVSKAEMLKTEILKSEVQKTEDRGQRTEDGGWRTEFSASGFSFSAFQLFSIFLTGWLLVVEAGTELWYRSHEWSVPKASTWDVDLPRDNPTFRDLPFSDKTKQFLRYDEGYNGTWQQGGGQKWQAIFFRWNPGRIAVHLAKSHTPEVCLTAAGRELQSQLGLRTVRVHGLQLPFRSYVVKDENGPLHVFYCLWEDRSSAQSFRTTSMSYANRLAPVLAGRRNSGQRSLEVAIWGIADQNEADAALARELEKLIKVEE